MKCLFLRTLYLPVPEFPELKVAAEICEDLWVAAPPSNLHAYRGANMIVNLSASDELAGKDTYRRNLEAVSQPDWCADISMLLPDRESPLRMWFTEAMI